MRKPKMEISAVGWCAPSDEAFQFRINESTNRFRIPLSAMQSRLPSSAESDRSKARINGPAIAGTGQKRRSQAGTRRTTSDSRVATHERSSSTSGAVSLPTFVAIDFETANRRPTSACAIGLVYVDRGVVADRFYHLIRPPIGASWVFSKLHGITDSDTRDQPSFGELWPTIARFLSHGEFAVAHNAAFDARVLRACCHRAGIRPPGVRFVCSLELSRSVLFIKPADLANVCRRLGIELNHHHALSDAEASARVALAAVGRGWRWPS